MAAVLQSRFTPISPSAAPRRAGALAAVAIHVLAVLALLSYEPSRSALFAVAPIMVDLISPPKPDPEKPTELPKPKPTAKVTPKPPITPEPTLTAPAEAPSSVAAAPPPAPVPIDVQRAAPALANTEPPVTQPIFNADYLDNPAPAYPPLSRRMNEQGRVVLRVFVSVAGRADDVQVRSSSGSVRLDDAARDAVRRWKFVPARRGSEPVAAWVLIPISFKLEG